MINFYLKLMTVFTNAVAKAHENALKAIGSKRQKHRKAICTHNRMIDVHYTQINKHNADIEELNKLEDTLK